MKEFEVHYKGHVIIEAETLREANEKMEKEYPQFETTDFYDCAEGKSNEVIGHCEMSGLSIFEGDKYEYDKEGVMWLTDEEDTD
jgi:hypothetical protein